MKFFIGQKIKKVRGVTGAGLLTATVTGYMDDWPYDLEVALDSPVVNSCGDRFVAGEVADAMSKDWEPILDPGATPSVFSYEELMDGLRSGELVAP